MSETASRGDVRDGGVTTHTRFVSIQQGSSAWVGSLVTLLPIVKEIAACQRRGVAGSWRLEASVGIEPGASLGSKDRLAVARNA